METHAKNREKIKVVRVTATEFELSNGQIFQHVVPLDEVPTPSEFQEHYNKCKKFLTPGENGKTTIDG